MSRYRTAPVRALSALVPAASRADNVESLEAVFNVDAIEVFAKAVGGRDQLAETLAVAGVGPEIERLTTLLLDPRYARWSLARLCKTVGLSVADLFTAYRKAGIAKAHVETSRIIASKLAPVVEDVMNRASPQRRLCGDCLGVSSTQGAEPCLRCESTGYITSEPDLDRQKLALELGQLLEKKGGLIVQQNNLAATIGSTASGSLEQLQQAVGDLLFGDRRAGDAEEVIEGEAVETPGDPAGPPEEKEPEDDEEPPIVGVTEPPAAPAPDLSDQP